MLQLLSDKSKYVCIPDSGSLPYSWILCYYPAYNSYAMSGATMSPDVFHFEVFYTWWCYYDVIVGPHGYLPDYPPPLLKLRTFMWSYNSMFHIYLVHFSYFKLFIILKRTLKTSHACTDLIMLRIKLLLFSRFPSTVMHIIYQIQMLTWCLWTYSCDIE